MKRIEGIVGASLALRIGAVFLVLGGTALAFLGGRGAATNAALSPPSLDLGGPTCSVPAEQSRVRWMAAERAATARLARYPFDAADGVEAVSLLHEAALCAERSADLVAAERLAELERTWIARIRDDFRARVVRVRVALEREPRGVALHEVTELRRMLAHTRGEYSTWLEATERRLERAGDRP